MRLYEDNLVELDMEFGVKNDGMSDQEKPSIQNRGSAAAATNNTAPPPDRPGSARSNRDRHERVILLKERQNSERIKKLEELKEQALAAARLREEQDSKRRKHFEELGKKDEERRRQAEERRRMLEEERRVTLQAKWEGKRSATPVSSRSNKPAYAFGSCTPRLLDNHVDGFLWKSQYNLNAPREPGLRASSAHDLHLQQNESSMETPMRVFCGRRKTDLTPTIPIKRDDYSVMSRSTSRGSGRVYSSMTRLDRSRSPGGSVTQHHQLHQGVPQRPSRSKSTTHLQSTGLKLTRTEILRQALANKKESGGIRSVDGSRPPSSMSSSLMTSSTHSQVQMRPRNSYALRKTRPASVHVTGVSSGESDPVTPNTHTTASSRRSETPASAKSAASRKVSNELSKPRGVSGASGKSSGKTSPSPMSQSLYETSTMKRPTKKKLSPSVSNSSAKLKTPEPPATAPATREQSNEVVKPVEKENSTPTPTPPTTDQSTGNNNKPVAQEFEIINNQQQEQQVSKTDSGKQNVDNFESIESAFASGSEDFAYNSKTPEPFAPTPDSNTNTSELLESAGRDSAATIEDNSQNWNNPFIDNVTPEPTHEVLKQPDIVAQEPASEQNKEDSDMKPKIMTEEEAKAALAEKRRLAREAVEREAARIAELERQELERQRLEEEEAERLAIEARKLEEERLRKAIEEEQKRQEEEKKRKEEEEKARVEKEKQERAAAKEAERIRLEMEERLRREEAERLERKRRVEAIMSRTRKKEAEQQQAKANNTNSNEGNSEMIGDVNGLKENIINEENSMQSSVNSLNNNFNNNNDFSGSTLDNGGGGSSNTLISFEGMGNTNAIPENGRSSSSDVLQLVPDSRDNIGAEFLESSGGVSGTTSPNTPPLIPNSLTGSSANNPIMNNPLQDLLS